MLPFESDQLIIDLIGIKQVWNHTKYFGVSVNISLVHKVSALVIVSDHEVVELFFEHLLFEAEHFGQINHFLPRKLFLVWIVLVGGIRLRLLGLQDWCWQRSL